MSPYPAAGSRHPRAGERGDETDQTASAGPRSRECTRPKKFGKKWPNGANCSSPNPGDYGMYRCTLPVPARMASRAPPWRAPLMVRAPMTVRFPKYVARRWTAPLPNGDNGGPEPRTSRPLPNGDNGPAATVGKLPPSSTTHRSGLGPLLGLRAGFSTSRQTSRAEKRTPRLVWCGIGRSRSGLDRGRLMRNRSLGRKSGWQAPQSGDILQDIGTRSVPQLSCSPQ
jgi:hypothetical protein